MMTLGEVVPRGRGIALPGTTDKVRVMVARATTLGDSINGRTETLLRRRKKTASKELNKRRRSESSNPTAASSGVTIVMKMRRSHNLSTLPSFVLTVRDVTLSVQTKQER